MLHQLVRDMAGALDEGAVEAGRLRLIVRQFQRARFGRRSERLDPGQTAFGLEELEADLARAEARKPCPAASADLSKPKKPPHRAPLPPLLPRDECVLPVPHDASSPMTRPCQCLIPGGERPKPVGSGPAPGMTDPGPGHPAVVFVHTPDRTAARPAGHLRGFRGILQVDGYAGFEQLAADGAVTLAACWAHARRKFHELRQAGSPVAGEALPRIAALHQTEAGIRGQPPAERQRVRLQQSRPLVDALTLWLELKLAHLPGRSRLAEAIRYALADGRSWAGSSTTAGRTQGLRMKFPWPAGS